MVKQNKTKIKKTTPEYDSERETIETKVGV